MEASVPPPTAPPPPPGGVPGARSARIGWGLPDVLVAWLVGVVAALVVATPLADPNASATDKEQIPALLAAVFAQNAGIIGWLAFVARRKGRGSLRTDFGLGVRLRDVWWVAVGVGVSILANLLLIPITELAHLKHSTQDVVRLFEGASGPEVPLFVIGVVLVAPVAEELLFRGALLRALLRRTSPPVANFVTALVFALVHVIGDPGTGYYICAFLLLGLVSGGRALRTRSLSQSIALHAGFNLLAVIVIVS
jgi:uncharacterized protein